MPVLAVLGERLRSRLWPLPAVAAVLGVLAAILLSRVPATGGWWAGRWWTGEPAAARSLLQVLAGSSLTVVALVFSLHVVALQLAASQYSPRLLRTYARDWVIQTALAVLIGTFAFCLVTLAALSPQTGPGASVTVAVALGLACVGALVGVVSHIVTSLRVETMMAELHADAERVITAWVDQPRADGLPRAEAGARMLADRSGFVQMVDADRLARWAAGSEAVIRVDVVPGEHVLVGQPLAHSWGSEQAALDDSDAGSAIVIGFERTPDQDPALGLVQLVDIALRALSPSLNDPTTARHALGHLTDLLVEVAARPDGADQVTCDEDGVPRVWRATRSLADFLDATCRPIARAGSADPDVLLALVGALRAVGRAAGGAGSEAVAAQLAHVERCAGRGLADPDDRRGVLGALAEARRSLGLG